MFFVLWFIIVHAFSDSWFVIAIDSLGFFVCLFFALFTCLTVVILKLQLSQNVYHLLMCALQRCQLAFCCQGWFFFYINKQKDSKSVLQNIRNNSYSKYVANLPKHIYTISLDTQKSTPFTDSNPQLGLQAAQECDHLTWIQFGLCLLSEWWTAIWNHCTATFNVIFIVIGTHHSWLTLRPSSKNAWKFRLR